MSLWYVVNDAIEPTFSGSFEAVLGWLTSPEAVEEFYSIHQHNFGSVDPDKYSFYLIPNWVVHKQGSYGLVSLKEVP